MLQSFLLFLFFFREQVTDFHIFVTQMRVPVGVNGDHCAAVEGILEGRRPSSFSLVACLCIMRSGAH